MIFVIKSGIKRDAYDTQKLHDKLYKELNEGGKKSGCDVTIRLYV